MKLFELYKQPIREDKTLTASLRLCESVTRLLEGMADFELTEEVTDPTVLAVRPIAIAMFGKPYSTAYIANGTVHRMSIPINHELSKQYRHVPKEDIIPVDRQKLVELKNRFFQELKQNGVDTSLVDVRYHVGAGVYLSVRTKIDQDVSEGLNDAGEFDFEPDPAFAGVKGVSRDTGAGEQDRKAAEHKKQNAKVNQTWMTLVSKLGKLDFQNAEKLKVGLIKLAKVAKKNNFKLTPSPEEVLG